MDKAFIDAAANEMSTIQDMLRWATSNFSIANIYCGHGTNNPWDESILLILPSLFLSIDLFEVVKISRLTYSERNHLISKIVRRIEERIPTSYITNKSWFCGHEFYVDERVLIPRSPLCELINNNFSGLINQYPKYILDMCTGSGCIAISCAYAFPDAVIDAVDISNDALAVARFNIKKHNLIRNINLISSDLFCNLPKTRYSLIITNPPYVASEDMHNLPKEYSYEPKLSLISGIDGLKLIRRILANASEYLNENGVLICEVGNSMLPLIEQYPKVPFTWLEFNSDGDGVFMLTKDQLTHASKYFSIYKS